MHSVVVTGLGIVSCLGNSIAEVEQSLRLGRSGVVVDEERRALGFRSPLTGMIRGFDPAALLTKKQRKTMPDFAVWAYAASLQALAMAGLRVDDIRNESSGLVFGCDASAGATVEGAATLRERGDTGQIGSGVIFRSMTSTVTMNLNTLLKTRGACWTIASACSSSGHALGQAADLVALGRQERVLCGGAQEITWQAMCSFDGLGAFSTRIDHPDQASRPFDIERDGLVPGGGAATLLLERRDLAERRGAPILAELAGYGFSSDGGHISVPGGDGLARSMRMALAGAGLESGATDCVSAHATGTPAGDAVEAAALLAVFGEHRPAVVCTKALTGHELWMSGAAQALYGIVMANAGFLAPHPNFTAPDATTAGLRIIVATTPATIRTMLCNSAGFGGTNASLLLRFPE